MILKKFDTIYFYLNTFEKGNFMTYLSDVLEIPQKGEGVLMEFQGVETYFLVKERIFDSIKNIVHIRLEETLITTDDLVLKGHEE